MNLIEKFELDKAIFIEVLVPDVKDKFNRYAQPTKQLHEFDEITVMLNNLGIKTIVALDDLNSVIFPFKGDLKDALNNQRELPDFIKIGELGRYYNQELFEETSNDTPNTINYSHFWLWSSCDARPETWLYNKNNKIYLEIIPSYPWLYTDLKKAKKKKNFISFEKFMSNYKPILTAEIPREVAEKWILQCDVILNKMVKCC